MAQDSRGLARVIGGLSLEHPLMNAAGVRCKTPVEVGELMRNDSVSAVVVGSMTLDQRDGNEGTTFTQCETGSLNSVGLANGGKPYYETHLSRMLEWSQKFGKPLILNIAGFSMEGYLSCVSFAQSMGAKAIELNLGCPNTQQGKLIAPICYDMDLTKAILGGVRGRFNGTIIAKYAPILDQALLAKHAKVVDQMGIDAVTAINTVPGALAYDDAGKPLTTPNNGFAGYGGSGIKPIALGQVKQWRDALPPEIAVIGVGGIQTGRDMRDFLTAGATAVQVATAHAIAGPSIFYKILSEYLGTLHAG